VNRVTASLVGPVFALAACSGGARPDPSAPVVEIGQVRQDVSDRDTEPAPASRREAPVATGEELEPAAPYEEIQSPWTPPPHMAGGVGGPDCDRAADCCMKFAHVHGPDPSLLSMCAGVRQAPVSSCVAMLTSFRQLAPQVGVQCN
jgi:hypothetical protein